MWRWKSLMVLKTLISPTVTFTHYSWWFFLVSCDTRPILTQVLAWWFRPCLSPRLRRWELWGNTVICLPAPRPPPGKWDGVRLVCGCGSVATHPHTIITGCLVHHLASTLSSFHAPLILLNVSILAASLLFLLVQWRCISCCTFWEYLVESYYCYECCYNWFSRVVIINEDTVLFKVTNSESCELMIFQRNDFGSFP